MHLRKAEKENVKIVLSKLNIGNGFWGWQFIKAHTSISETEGVIAVKFLKIWITEDSQDSEF